MGIVRVSHVMGDRFTAYVRGHVLDIDQPVADGGADSGPTPTELFVTGLVACVAHYARGYLARHGLEDSGLNVVAEWEFAKDRPSRVVRVGIEIDAPGLPAQRRAGLLAVASSCTVHNSLVDPPEISIVLADGAGELTPAARR